MIFGAPKLDGMARQPKKISDFDVKLGAVIRGRRAKATPPLTQMGVATAAGIPLGNYKRREDGVNEVTTSELQRIAAALGTTAESIVTEALDDYGGLEKLIAEHTTQREQQSRVSEAVVSLSDYRPPADMTDDELDEQRRAAGFDAELEEDEPNPT